MKIEEKRRLKKIAIMEAALDVWSLVDYRRTSLNDLARNLGMTKQGLYRYFKNKDDLLESISAYSLEVQESWYEDLIQNVGREPEKNRLPFLIASLADSIETGSRYSQFAHYYAMRSGCSIRQTHSRQLALLSRQLQLPEKLLHLIMFYCYFMWGWHESVHVREKRSRKEKIDLILELVENGLADKAFAFPENWTEFTETARILQFKQKMLQENLFNAVVEVLREKGFGGVTLERIAEKAGMSKSTLYNYFKNKNDLLTKTMSSLVKEYRHYHSRLLDSRNSFEEKLLAHLEMQCLLFPREPYAFLVLKQFMSRDVLESLETPAADPGFLSFIEEGIKQKKLKALLSPMEYQMIFSFFIIIERVVYKREDEGPLTEEILNWLRLLAYGRNAFESIESTRSK